MVGFLRRHHKGNAQMRCPKVRQAHFSLMCSPSYVRIARILPLSVSRTLTIG